MKVVHAYAPTSSHDDQLDEEGTEETGTEEAHQWVSSKRENGGIQDIAAEPIIGLNEEDDLNVQAMKGNLTGIIKECSTEVGGNVVRQDTGILFQEERQSRKASNPTDRIEVEELYKLINKR